MDVPSVRLPVLSTPLLGRDEELAALGAAMAGPDNRLTTLTGPPGVGKTRLAIAAAAVVEQRSASSVAFVELTAIRDPDLVLPAVARALGLGEASGRSLTERFVTSLPDRDLLVVADNFEHVLDAGPALATVLAACPRLRLLATSRERLGLRGEREHPVPPLALPAPGDVVDLERFAATPSVAMLLHRVRGFQPAFEVNPTNAGALAEICVRLDGLPLALELAAARMKLFTPGELTFRLRHRMDLLTGGSRDAPDRHRTLRAALTWSHDLLNPDERATFRRLAVFVGSWSLDAATQVCDVPDAVQTVASLVDKSLIRRSDPDGDGFVMLESLREYGAELLVQRGEAAVTRDRHAAYYAELGARAEAMIGTDEETTSLDGVGVAEGNLREALAHATSTGRIDMCLQLATALGWYFYTRGHLGQGQATLHGVLATADAGPRPAPDDALAGALLMAGVLSVACGAPDDAEQVIDRSMGIGERLGDLRRQAIGSAFRGHLARARGAGGDAVAHYDRAGKLHERLGSNVGVAWSRYDLGLLARHRGDDEQAAGLLTEALDRFRGSGHEWAVGCSAWALATVELGRGRVVEAAALLTESLGRFETMEDGRGLAQCLEATAKVACTRGCHGSAARLHAAAATLRERLAAPMPDEDRRDHHALTQRVRRHLGPAAADAERRIGRGLSAAQSLALAHGVLDHGALDPSDGPPNTAPPEAPPVPDRANPLTPREQQVAHLVATGRTNRQIGRALGIAEKTTEVHVHHIIGKLGARSRAEVAVWAVTEGRHG